MGATLVQVNTITGTLQSVTRNCAVESRTWVHNGIGTASIFFPYTTTDLDYYTAYGSVLRIYERGLVPWVGLAVSREWNDQGVTLKLKSAEWLLTGKLTSQGQVYGATAGRPQSVGTVAQLLYQNAVVSNAPIRGVLPGVFDAPGNVFRQYDYADLYEAIHTLTTETNTAFWVDQNLRFHVRQSRGVERLSGANLVVLREHDQIIDVQVQDSIEALATAVIAIGNGDKLVNKNKQAIRVDDPRIFRGKTLDVQSTDGNAIRKAAIDALRTSRFPKVTVDATLVNDRGPGLAWALPFWVGDTVQLVLRRKEHRLINVLVTGLEVGSDTIRCIFEVVPPKVGISVVDWKFR